MTHGFAAWLALAACTCLAQLNPSLLNPGVQQQQQLQQQRQQRLPDVQRSQPAPLIDVIEPEAQPQPQHPKTGP